MAVVCIRLTACVCASVQVSGEWRSAKCQADAVKLACSILRAAQSLGAEPTAVIGTKAKAAIAAASDEILSAGSGGRLAGCLAQLLPLLGIESASLKKGTEQKRKGAKRKTDGDDMVQEHVEMSDSDDSERQEDEEAAGKRGAGKSARRKIERSQKSVNDGSHSGGKTSGKRSKKSKGV